MNNDDFLAICKSLTSLALLKGETLEEERIALMAKFLLRDLTRAEIERATGYFAQRLERFPEPAHYFNLLAPTKSVDEVVEKEIGTLFELIRGPWDVAKSKITHIQSDLLNTWRWNDLASCREGELPKIRTAMSFYLKKKLGSDTAFIMDLSKKAINEHKGVQIEGKENLIN